jgi:hypothetical protein
MVLLVNCFITNKSATGGHWESLGIKQDRGNLRQDNKIDILKYSLSSFASAYPWTRAIIKVKLDDNYSSDEIKLDLEEYVKKEFEDIDLIFFHERNITQQDWIDTYSLINDDLIHCYCGHDHIFYDSSSDYLIKMVKSVKENYKDEYTTLVLSHFPESIRTAKCGYIDHHLDVPSNFNKTYKLEENYLSYDSFCYDSINIISKKLYEDWFLKGKWDDALQFYPPNTFKSGHLELPRIDGVGITDLNFIRNKLLNIPTPKQKIIIPYKEIARHYDGYFYQGITNNQCPSIDIPLGFFENDIQIRYGYDDYKEGWTNINPKNDHYYAYDKSGTDYKFTLNDLPLVWKNKISTIDINPDIDEEEMIQYRLKAVLEIIYTSANGNPYKYHSHIDKELENNIINEYLQNYPEYQII